MSANASPIHVFYSYSHKDEKFRDQLEEHLTILKRDGLLQTWHDRKILPGKEWRSEIDENLEHADLILLLISSSFIASDYCYEKELTLAMSRHESGQARVIPIFVRPTEWQGAPFAGLQGLPRDAMPVTQWGNEDLAWQSIASSLREVLKEIQEQKTRQIGFNRAVTLKQALREDIERIEITYNLDVGIDGIQPGIEGIQTGFREFDHMVNGLNPGELLVLASRPSMGKTALALNISLALAAQKAHVLIFSTKLPARDIARRMLISKAHINPRSISDDDWPKLTHALGVLSDTNIQIDDSPSISFQELRERCLHSKKEMGTFFFLIDSIDYMNADHEHSAAQKDVGKSLKQLARELDAVILVTSNVSREVELRPNKRPVLRDIKIPGLADEADVIAFIYNESHYNPETPDQNTSELIVAKNQFGRLGTIQMTHFAQYGSFQMTGNKG